MSNKVVVYTSNTCPYCTMLKNFLNDEGVAYTEINLSIQPQLMNNLIAMTGQMGVPQSNVNGHWVLGYNPDGIKQYLHS